MANEYKFILALLLLTFSGICAGESNNAVSTAWDSRFQLRAGVFSANLDSSISIDSTLGRNGDGLDFERHLGLPKSKSTFYGGASWRFAPKHVLEWEFFDLARDGTTTTEKSWNIGDTTILANGQILSAFNVRINRFTYKYRFFEHSRTKINFMAGLHGVRFNADLTLSGNLIINGEPVFVSSGEPNVEVEKKKFPLPHFGLGIDYALAPRLNCYAMVKGFALEIGDTSGNLIEANVGVQYQLTQKFGIGGGVKSFFVDVGDDKNALVDVDFEFEFFGPVVYMMYTF